jgi:hypothetical protein
VNCKKNHFICLVVCVHLQIHKALPKFVGFAHREETIHLCKIWTWGSNFCSLIGQCEDDKCSRNEKFQMDVIFHVWVDVTLSTLGLFTTILMDFFVGFRYGFCYICTTKLS